MAEKDLSVITSMSDIVSEMEAQPEPESTQPESAVWQVGKEETPEATTEVKRATDGPKEDEKDETPPDEEESDGLERVATKDDLKNPEIKARVEQLEKGYQKELAKLSKRSEVRDSYWNAFDDPATREDAYFKLGQQLGIKQPDPSPQVEAKAVDDEEEERLYAQETASQTKQRWLREFKESVRTEIRAELEKEYGDVVSYTREQKQTAAQMARAKEHGEELQAEFGEWLTTDLIASAFQRFPDLEPEEAVGAAYAARIRKHFANISPKRQRISTPRSETAEAEGWVPGQPYSMQMAYADIARERDTG